MLILRGLVQKHQNPGVAKFEQARSLFSTIFSVMESNQELVDYLSDTLISLGDSVPEEIDGCKVTVKNPANDKTLFNVGSLPSDLFVAPGEKAPNRVGFSLSLIHI